MLVVLDPIEREIRRRLQADVGEEGRERMTPTPTDTNPAAAVVGPVLPTRICAASDHSDPGAVLRSLADGVAVRQEADAVLFVAQATTRAGVAVPEVQTEHDATCSTLAPNDESQAVMFRRRAAQHDQASEPRARLEEQRAHIR